MAARSAASGSDAQRVPSHPSARHVPSAMTATTATSMAMRNLTHPASGLCNFDAGPRIDLVRIRAIPGQSRRGSGSPQRARASRPGRTSPGVRTPPPRARAPRATARSPPGPGPHPRRWVAFSLPARPAQGFDRLTTATSCAQSGEPDVGIPLGLPARPSRTRQGDLALVRRCDPAREVQVEPTATRSRGGATNPSARRRARHTVRVPRALWSRADQRTDCRTHRERHGHDPQRCAPRKECAAHTTGTSGLRRDASTSPTPDPPHSRRRMLSVWIAGPARNLRYSSFRR